MKLIKINTDHYIVVDDSPIQEYDWFISSDGNIFQYANGYTPNDTNGGEAGCKKITHSTQPLSIIKGVGENSNKNYYYGDGGQLSLQEVKELIGEVDVEKKADDIVSKWYGNGEHEMQKCFVMGYNQALEDSKVKKYTEENMKYMFECGRNFQSNGESTFTISILHIEPKTEWEVEIVDGKLNFKK